MLRCIVLILCCVIVSLSDCCGVLYCVCRVLCVVCYVLCVVCCIVLLSSLVCCVMSLLRCVCVRCLLCVALCYSVLLCDVLCYCCVVYYCFVCVVLLFCCTLCESVLSFLCCVVWHCVLCYCTNAHHSKFFLSLLALGYAVIFGQVTAIVQQAQKHSEKYHSLLDNIRSFQKLYRVPEELSARILDYFMSTWALTKGVDTDEVRVRLLIIFVPEMDNIQKIPPFDRCEGVDRS